jgi:hypothetical protein
LLIAGDREFRIKYSDQIAECYARITDINSAFSPADVYFNIMSIRMNTGNELKSKTTAQLLSDYRDLYGTYKDLDHCDVAILFSGKNLNGPVGGSYVYNGYTNAAWAVVQMVPRPGDNYQATVSHRNIIIAHELGHTLGALHMMPDGTEYPPLWARPISWDDWGTTKYSVMWPQFQGDTQQLQFSTSSWWPLGYHGDANHDNRQAIINNKDTVAVFDPW